MRAPPGPFHCLLLFLLLGMQQPLQRGRFGGAPCAAPTLKFSALATASKISLHLASSASSLGMNSMPTLQARAKA